MPEEIEVPTEQLQESIHEEAHKAHHHGPDGPSVRDWIPWVALSSAILAVLAALAALLAGHHANEGVLEEIQAGDRWSYYQAKGIKSSVLQTKIELLRELERTPKPDDVAQVERYKDEQKKIEDDAHELEHSSDRHMGHHNVFARTVTLFQIAIALAAISVLARRRWVWFISMGLSALGLASLIQAFV
jgi:hypothetical protein